MASSSPLLDIEENFFICPVCLDYFREPKLLPCLHRFCKGCLHGVIEEKHGAFDCPMCNHPCAAESVDEFKTDFYVKSMLEYIQLKRTFEQKDGRECVACSQTKKVEAYCFECEDFLCEECYQFHSTNKMFAKHVKHLLNVKYIGAKGLTLEKLTSLNGAPRCNTHPDHVAQLLCGTCGNAPICIACTYGLHKGHEFHEVTTLARTQREDLVKKMTDIEKYKDNLYKLPGEIEITRRKLKENVLKEKEKLKSQLEKQLAKIDEDNRQNDQVLEQSKAEATRKKEKECSRAWNDCEAKISRLREECKKTVQDVERKYDSVIQHANEEHGKMKVKLASERVGLEGDFKSSVQLIDEQKGKHEQEIEEISEHAKRTINRYENVAATTSAMLASKDDWLNAQCIPDIGAAYEPLMSDVKRELPKLEPLSVITPRKLSPASVSKVTVSDQEISVIKFKGGEGWYNIDLATCVDSIVITSKAPDEFSYITVLNLQSKVLHQKKIKACTGGSYSWRFCSKLTWFKVVTVMQDTEIGVYDIRDGTYTQTVFNFKAPWQVSCITTDPVNRTVLVGYYRSNTLVVFDNELNHLHQLKLPSVPKGLSDISIHERLLLVTDRQSKVAYACSITGQKVELMYEFTKPGKIAHCCPQSVCSDSNGFIYILWDVTFRNYVVAQYSRDGGQILTTKQINEDARVVRVLADEEGEKLLVATRTSGKVFVYGLNPS